MLNYHRIAYVSHKDVVGRGWVVAESGVSGTFVYDPIKCEMYKNVLTWIKDEPLPDNFYSRPMPDSLSTDWYWSLEFPDMNTHDGLL